MLSEKNEKLSEIFKKLTLKEKKHIWGSIINGFSYAIKEKAALLIVPDVYREIVLYMEKNNKVYPIYFSQKEYNNPEFFVVKEEWLCKIVDQGKFNPFEYNTVGDFLNEYSINGTISFHEKYKREVFQPEKIAKTLSIVFHGFPEGHELFNFMYENMDRIHEVQTDVARYAIQRRGFKDALVRWVNKNIEEIILSKTIANKSFNNAYIEGCKMAGIVPQKREYVSGYNEYFYPKLWQNTPASTGGG